MVTIPGITLPSCEETTDPALYTEHPIPARQSHYKQQARLWHVFSCFLDSFLTFGPNKVNHLAVVLEHVHLLDGGDVGHADPLQGRRELFVVCFKYSCDGILRATAGGGR